jgi:peptide/nickel transport system ATP-binding protein
MTGQAQGAPALRVRDLRVAYDGRPVLCGVDLDVPAGRTVALVGRSGCGKTTLLRAVLGLLPRAATASGSVQVAGQEVLGQPERALRPLRGPLMGYVAQDPYAACDPLRSVGSHVEEAWRAHGRRPAEGEVAARCDRVGIATAAQRLQERPGRWSGGMLQRATTVAATSQRPAVVLADEPTSALDAELADDALELLRGTASAVLLVSHDLALVARHADEVVVLDGGTVVERGPATRVLASPQHAVTRALRDASAPPARSSRPTTGRPAVVELCAVSHGYGGPLLLDEVDLQVHAGEVVGVVGPSGTGKSTLLRVAAGTESPRTGSVRFAGGARWPRKGWVMPVFQDPVASLDRRWPLQRTVLEPLDIAGPRLPRAERAAAAQAALERVGLGHVSGRARPDELSVGMCQRVAVARALAAGPALVVADEPTASLDVEAAAQVAGLLRSAADAGTAVLAVSHDAVRLRSIADRVLRLSGGRLVPA